MENIKLKNFKDKGWTWIGRPADNYGQYYHDANTNLWVSYNEAPSEVTKFAEQTFKKGWIVTMIKQPPGSFFPGHTDTHYKFRLKNKHARLKDIVRYCVFLQDWKPGHYFELDYKPLVSWSKGDICVIKPNIHHRSANAGDEMKYTLQITGILN